MVPDAPLQGSQGSGKHALPPSTSSPMIRHAAVLIVLAKFCCAAEEAIVPAVNRAPVVEMGVL